LTLALSPMNVFFQDIKFIDSSTIYTDLKCELTLVGFKILPALNHS
jgi:hypothetical protein